MLKWFEVCIGRFNTNLYVQLIPGTFSVAAVVSLSPEVFTAFTGASLPALPHHYIPEFIL